MFQKTRFRLVALNAIVVFLLLNGLGTAVFFTVKIRLYSQVDWELEKAAQRLLHNPLPRLHPVNEDMYPYDRQERKKFAEMDRRLVLLVWDKSGKILGTAFGERMEPDDLFKFRREGTDDRLETLKVEDELYRVKTLHIAKPVFVNQTLATSAQIQIIYNLAPEENMLESLLYVVVLVNLVSLLIALAVGWFLAKKALVPIQISWEKQQQFIADASHELRTPLAAIMLNLERLFRHPDHTIEQESEKIMIGLQEAKRLNKLVSDLLTLARSDSNELQIMQERFRVDEVAERCAQVFSHLAVAKGVSLETAIEAPLEMVGDEERIHQLLVILLDNALKYTGKDGRIFVSCRREGQRVAIAVKDTGIGIPAKDLPFVFDRFYRVDKMRSKTPEGTGLGLSIAKWIVDAHQGKIQVASEEGVGTTVLVTLPLK